MERRFSVKQAAERAAPGLGEKDIVAARDQRILAFAGPYEPQEASKALKAEGWCGPKTTDAKSIRATLGDRTIRAIVRAQTS